MKQVFIAYDSIIKFVFGWFMMFKVTFNNISVIS